MSDDPVIVRVSGFTIADAIFDDDDLEAVAYNIASDIGMSLAALGSSCLGGNVAVEVLGREAVSDGV